MVYRKVILAAVLAALGGAASAVVPDNVVSQTGSLLGSADDFVSFSVDVMHKGRFTDLFYFSVTSAGDVFASSIALNLGQVNNIINLAGSIHAVGSSVNVLSFDGNNSVYSAPITIGDYVLEMTGVATGKNVISGKYMGALTLDPLATAPVPEPESYAMFLAGLGVMGLIAQRRRSAR